jgi:hypothetical protein
MFSHKNIEEQIMGLNANDWKSPLGLEVQQPYRMEERLRFNSVAIIPGDIAPVKASL